MRAQRGGWVEAWLHTARGNRRLLQPSPHRFRLYSCHLIQDEYVVARLYRYTDAVFEAIEAGGKLMR